MDIQSDKSEPLLNSFFLENRSIRVQRRNKAREMLHDQTCDTRESLISTSGTGRQVRGDVTGIGGNCKCASVEQSPPPLLVIPTAPLDPVLRGSEWPAHLVKRWQCQTAAMLVLKILKILHVEWLEKMFFFVSESLTVKEISQMICGYKGHFHSDFSRCGVLHLHNYIIENQKHHQVNTTGELCMRRKLATENMDAISASFQIGFSSFLVRKDTSFKWPKTKNCYDLTWCGVVWCDVCCVVWCGVVICFKCTLILQMYQLKSDNLSTTYLQRLYPELRGSLLPSGKVKLNSASNTTRTLGIFPSETLYHQAMLWDQLVIVYNPNHPCCTSLTFFYFIFSYLTSCFIQSKNQTHLPFALGLPFFPHLCSSDLSAFGISSTQPQVICCHISQATIQILPCIIEQGLYNPCSHLHILLCCPHVATQTCHAQCNKGCATLHASAYIAAVQTCAYIAMLASYHFNIEISPAQYQPATSTGLIPICLNLPCNTLQPLGAFGELFSKRCPKPLLELIIGPWENDSQNLKKKKKKRPRGSRRAKSKHGNGSRWVISLRRALQELRSQSCLPDSQKKTKKTKKLATHPALTYCYDLMWCGVVWSNHICPLLCGEKPRAHKNTAFYPWETAWLGPPALCQPRNNSDLGSCLLMEGSYCSFESSKGGSSKDHEINVSGYREKLLFMANQPIGHANRKFEAALHYGIQRSAAVLPDFPRSNMQHPYYLIVERQKIAVENIFHIYGPNIHKENQVGPFVPDNVKVFGEGCLNQCIRNLKIEISDDMAGTCNIYSHTDIWPIKIRNHALSAVEEFCKIIQNAADTIIGVVRDVQSMRVIIFERTEVSEVVMNESKISAHGRRRIASNHMDEMIFTFECTIGSVHNLQGQVVQSFTAGHTLSLQCRDMVEMMRRKERAGSKWGGGLVLGVQAGIGGGSGGQGLFRRALWRLQSGGLRSKADAGAVKSGQCCREWELEGNQGCGNSIGAGTGGRSCGWGSAGVLGKIGSQSFRITIRQKIHSLFPGCSVQRSVTRECFLFGLKKDAHQCRSFLHQAYSTVHAVGPCLAVTYWWMFQEGNLSHISGHSETTIMDQRLHVVAKTSLICLSPGGGQKHAEPCLTYVEVYPHTTGSEPQKNNQVDQNV
ncbi:hypothetical protein VP01_2094g2 [Puccinia sorghi]|uniref:Uncharacterized protein n=1 Tax=Puccinia sorghi TaxID=27349 RepID=A0A0L6VC41_9BASI|nr:hypothetical protein VP01_2094g2 [Puccinia sorghi]